MSLYILGNRVEVYILKSIEDVKHGKKPNLSYFKNIYKNKKMPKPISDLYGKLTKAAKDLKSAY